MRPIALDLFCKAGGAGEGLRRAGFDVIGVDIEHQPNYRAGRFVRANALEILDLIDASGECSDGAIGTAPLSLIWCSPPVKDEPHTSGGLTT